MHHTIDFSDLRQEVLDKWESDGVDYLRHENNGFQEPDPSFYETFIKPDYDSILDDPMACIAELGFTKMSDYIASKQIAKQPESEGITLGYSLISDKCTKFFFEKNGADLEFYIERDGYGSATLTLRPGYVGVNEEIQLAKAIADEFARARRVK